MMRFISAEYLAKKDNIIARFLNRVINGCQINPRIPDDTQLQHCGFGVIIGYNVKIGKNVNIYQGVRLGGNLNNEMPIIEDNVTLCSNVMIFGRVRIGKGSIIGAGSFVNKDIPPNSLVYNKKRLVIKKIKSKNK